MKQLEEVLKELDDILVSFDVKRMREFIKEYSVLYTKETVRCILERDDTFTTCMMAKMTLSRETISEDKKEIARNVLIENGWGTKIFLGMTKNFNIKK